MPLYSTLGINNIEVFSFYSSFSRVWEFAVGGIVYFLSYKNNKQKVFNKQIVFFFILIFGIVLLRTAPASILVVFITTLVIFFKALDELPNVMKTILKWIGDRSYSIYLIHLPVIYIARYPISISVSSDSNKFWRAVLALFFIALVGSLIYSKVESPFRNAYKNNFFSLR